MREVNSLFFISTLAGYIACVMVLIMIYGIGKEEILKPFMIGLFIFIPIFSRILCLMITCGDDANVLKDVVGGEE